MKKKKGKRIREEKEGKIMGSVGEERWKGKRGRRQEGMKKGGRKKEKRGNMKYMHK